MNVRRSAFKGRTALSCSLPGRIPVKPGRFASTVSSVQRSESVPPFTFLKPNMLRFPENR